MYSLEVLMIQAVSVLAALAVLVAYAANQLGLIGPSNLSYTLLNLFGALILASIAVIEAQWGFLLQEGVWTLVSLLALVKLLKSAGKDANSYSNRVSPRL
jgi:ABC-type uncharacterized transport system permease subunit